MGISKSILNYVIFCHQDELSWPFDQGKILKDRFDEIFDSAKFNKALESILKLCKDLQADIRGLTAEKESLKRLVSEVDSKEKQLQECEQRFETTKEKIEIIDKELEDLKGKIKKKEEFHSRYKSLQADEGELTKNSCNSTRTKTNWLLYTDKKKMEYNMHKEQYLNLRHRIKDIFEGSREELNAHIQSYDSILKKKNNEIKEVQLYMLIRFLTIPFYVPMILHIASSVCRFQNEIEIKGISEKENKISNILATRRETVGTLKQQVKDQERRIDRRNQLLESALQNYGLDTIGSDVSEIGT